MKAKPPLTFAKTDVAHGDLLDPQKFEGFLDWYLDKTRRTFETCGRYLPQAAVLAMKDPHGNDLPGPGLHLLFPMGDFGSAETKDAFAARIASHALLVEAFGIVFGSEAWMAHVPEGEIHSCGPVADRPGRKEVLMLNVEHVAFTATRSYLAAITRDPKGKPRLEEFKRMDGVIEGRFSGLLRMREAFAQARVVFTRYPDAPRQSPGGVIRKGEMMTADVSYGEMNLRGNAAAASSLPGWPIGEPITPAVERQYSDFMRRTMAKVMLRGLGFDDVS